MIKNKSVIKNTIDYSFKSIIIMYNNSFRRIKEHVLSGSERTKQIKKNVMLSSILRIISISVSLLIVPATINYVNSERYGIWLALSSVISILSYFDFGFAHGFRNKFTESISKGDILLARKYLSTTYVSIGMLFCLIMLLASLCNYYINWSVVLGVSLELNQELQTVFQILIIFFCISMVCDVFLTMLTANHQPAMSAAIKTIGSLLSLFFIIILTYTTEGNIHNLAFAYAGIPCIFTIIVSVISFKSRFYSHLCPSFKLIDFSLSKNIIGKGSQFFVIMLSMMFIFQFTNIIISRILGPESVTLYNVTCKLFSIVEMAVMIILSPIWSAYTDAYTRKDFEWMKRSSIKLEKIGWLCLPVLILLIFTSPLIFNIWLGTSVKPSFVLTLIVGIYIYCKIMGNIYMYQINGTGKVRLQTITYVITAVVSIPAMYYCCTKWGLYGVVVVPTVLYTMQFIICRIQLNRIVNQKAHGIWDI